MGRAAVVAVPRFTGSLIDHYPLVTLYRCFVKPLHLIPITWHKQHDGHHVTITWTWARGLFVDKRTCFIRRNKLRWWMFLFWCSFACWTFFQTFQTKAHASCSPCWFRARSQCVFVFFLAASWTRTATPQSATGSVHVIFVSLDHSEGGRLFAVAESWAFLCSKHIRPIFWFLSKCHGDRKLGSGA